MVAHREVPLSLSPSRRPHLEHIVYAALAGVAPGRLIDAAIAARPPLRGPHSLYALVAAGKAAVAMSAAYGARAPGRITEGVVVDVSAATAPLPAGCEVFRGGHPVPDCSSVAAGEAALALARRVDADAELVVLLSGGASALLAVPATGVSLAEKVATTQALLRAGVAIDDINTVRKHVSAIKGGQLAAACRGRVTTWAISDIVAPIADDPAVIGSGPTVADPSSFGDALRVARSVERRFALPPSVVARLEAGAVGRLGETPKPGDPRLSRSRFELVGSRRDAMDAARDAAERLGYAVIVHEEPIIGSAREAARTYAARLSALAVTVARPTCLVSSGETTVRVVGRGKGGRNQEFALALVDAWGTDAHDRVVACVGTDGIDGPTDAAGAMVDAGTMHRAARAGLAAARAYLDDNDAYSYFDATGDLVRTGPTGTNVADLQIALVG